MKFSRPLAAPSAILLFQWCLRGLFVALTIGGLLTCSADELTIDTASLPLTNVPWPTPTQVKVRQFDPALGSLQSIRLELRGRAQTLGTLLNLSTLDQTVFVTIESMFNIREGQRLLLQSQVTGISATLDIAAGESTPSPTVNGTITRSITLTNSLEAFIGTNTVALTLGEQTTNRVTGSSRVRYSPLRTRAGADVTITYTYLTGLVAPEFVGAVRTPDGTALLLTLTAPPGRLCRLLGALVISDSTWLPVGENTVPPDGNIVFTNNLSEARQFFRAVLP